MDGLGWLVSSGLKVRLLQNKGCIGCSCILVETPHILKKIKIDVCALCCVPSSK